MEYETKAIKMSDEISINCSDIEKRIVRKKNQIIPKAVIH
jgi:hypothetical protein